MLTVISRWHTLLNSGQHLHYEPGCDKLSCLLKASGNKHKTSLNMKLWYTPPNYVAFLILQYRTTTNGSSGSVSVLYVMTRYQTQIFMCCATHIASHERILLLLFAHDTKRTAWVPEQQASTRIDQRVHTKKSILILLQQNFPQHNSRKFAKAAEGQKWH